MAATLAYARSPRGPGPRRGGGGPSLAATPASPGSTARRARRSTVSDVPLSSPGRSLDTGARRGAASVASVAPARTSPGVTPGSTVPGVHASALAGSPLEARTVRSSISSGFSPGSPVPADAEGAPSVRWTTRKEAAAAAAAVAAAADAIASTPSEASRRHTLRVPPQGEPHLVERMRAQGDAAAADAAATASREAAVQRRHPAAGPGVAKSGGRR